MGFVFSAKFFVENRVRAQRILILGKVHDMVWYMLKCLLVVCRVV